MQKYFNIFALKNRLEKFELSVSHQRIYVHTQKNANKKELPVTYNDAMDRLLTTNDTVTVVA